MLGFKKLNEINGFDEANLNNAKQNNYAWSMAEFGDYMYVGTGRNIAAVTIQLLGEGAKVPLLIRSDKIENNAEIWRYKKDGTREWERVYKASAEENIAGFRYMIVHASENSTPALYAASFAFRNDPNGVTVLKTTDGSNWTKVGGHLEGGSSRAMVSFNGNLYISTIESAIGGERSLLYVSKDPEFFDFELVIDYNSPEYIKEKNPMGGIDNMEVFNNKLYISVASNEGLEVWRSNTDMPKLNEWTRVIDKGFGDGLNKNSLAMGVYKDHLYITAVKGVPLVLLIPIGAEVVRIDKDDKWELVVGGDPIIKTEPVTGTRTKSISGYDGGFSNPFNVYVWQIREFKDKLFATTFDHGSNIEVLRDIVLKNRDMLISAVGEGLYNLIIKLYDTILNLFNRINYPRGFNMYMSNDGVHFMPISLDGLGNGNNYGGRILMVSSDNDLYVGTANPYDGCEVLKNKTIDPRTYGMNANQNWNEFKKNLSEVLGEIEEDYNNILNAFANNNKIN
ncbi:hypothetical protein [Clostridium sp. SM-530-WT-3G]|uniref:hypothetical protein n=1 Tax=Clostridium sp. SM-530-WT-3G TaxID=2725303 RepID=UPI00145D184D|nr:hypothetical protein [Clostridium sp. SM-530-WT-3G]NME83995.1 hypothetical protein [Clostridium sp. SM-530-WT-3G]